MFLNHKFMKRIAKLRAVKISIEVNNSFSLDSENDKWEKVIYKLYMESGSLNLEAGRPSNIVLLRATKVEVKC